MELFVMPLSYHDHRDPVCDEAKKAPAASLASVKADPTHPPVQATDHHLASHSSNLSRALSSSLFACTTASIFDE